MHFTHLPPEIQTRVVVLSASATSLAPLSHLSQTCRHLHLLIHGSSDVLGNLCNELFDLAAPTRRLGPLTNEQCAAETRRRWEALARIARGAIHGDMIIHDLWVAYVLLLEDDGRNLALLEKANVEKWSRDIIVLRGKEQVDRHGWRLETELLQLAAAVLARVNTRASVIRESKQERERLLEQVEPFWFAGHRYPIALLPTTQHFVSHTYPLPASHSHTFHTMASAPVYPANRLPFLPFGRQVSLSCPPLALSSILLWFLRTQRSPLGHRPNIPVDRAAAEAIGYHNATIQDYEEANLVRELGLGVEVPRASPDNGGSRRWDPEWYRLAFACRVLRPDPYLDEQLSSCWYRTVYEPGMFRGNWFGQSLFPAFAWYTRMLQMHPASFEDVVSTLREDELFIAVMLMQLNLREHFTSEVGDEVGVGHAEEGDGVQNGWFPNQIDISEPFGNMRLTTDELVITDPQEPDEKFAVKHYKTWHPGTEFPEADRPPPFPLVPEDIEELFSSEFDDDEDSDGYSEEYEEEEEDSDVEYPTRVDVIVTGETDYAHGEAWGPAQVYGRVRRNDGLIVLVHVPLRHGSGRWIFRGYAVGGHAIVGRWRETGTSMDVAGMEGPFVLARIPESWPLTSSESSSPSSSSSSSST